MGSEDLAEMVEEGDLDDKLEDKATNEVVDDVKKVAMEGVDNHHNHYNHHHSMKHSALHLC